MKKLLLDQKQTKSQVISFGITSMYQSVPQCSVYLSIKVQKLVGNIYAVVVTSSKCLSVFGCLTRSFLFVRSQRRQ